MFEQRPTINMKGLAESVRQCIVNKLRDGLQRKYSLDEMYFVGIIAGLRDGFNLTCIRSSGHRYDWLQNEINLFAKKSIDLLIDKKYKPKKMR